jgi:hypothetical protein
MCQCELRPPTLTLSMVPSCSCGIAQTRRTTGMRRTITWCTSGAWP